MSTNHLTGCEQEAEEPYCSCLPESRKPERVLYDDANEAASEAAALALALSEYFGGKGPFVGRTAFAAGWLARRAYESRPTRCRCGREAVMLREIGGALKPYCPACEYGPVETCDCVGASDDPE